MSHSSLPSRQSRAPSQNASIGTHANWPSTGVAHRASLPQHLKSFSPEDNPSGHSPHLAVAETCKERRPIRTHVGVLVGSVAGPAVGVAVAAPAAGDAEAAARAAELARAARAVPRCNGHRSYENRFTASTGCPSGRAVATYCSRARRRRPRSARARRSATRRRCSARRPRTPTRPRRTSPAPPSRCPPQPRPVHLHTEEETS